MKTGFLSKVQAADGKAQKGSALLSVIIMFPFIIFIVALYMSLSIASFQQSKTDQLRTEAQLTSDAGTDYAVQQVNVDATWTGTSTADAGWTGVGREILLHDDGAIRTTYEITVTDVDSDTKTITSVGRTYSPATATTPKNTITIKTDLRAVTSGNFSLVTGVGGLYMSNSAKILGGDVHVNGEVSLSNTAQIGLSTSPVKLHVAHQNCPIPADATYPTLCGSGNGQPITINNQAHIYGDVEANNQTSGAGMSSPGLTASSGVAALPLPTHDRDAQKAAAVNNMTNSAASCSGSQTRTWPANTKITGDVNVSNNCVVTVEGDVWITGSLNASNSSRIKVSDSLGSTRPNIMVDGNSGLVLSNTAKLLSNSSNTGFQIITYHSDASCSPDCANVTGVDLYNSRNDTTINMSNLTEAANTILYAKWSRVQINNSGSIGALVGQTIALSNTGTITFGTSVPGVGTTGWVIDNYRRTFN